MVTVGAFVRARKAAFAEVAAQLSALEDVSTLELEEPGTIGVLIQAPDIDRAHAKLVHEVRAIEGVLVAWPVHTELGPPAGVPTGWRDASIPIR